MQAILSAGAAPYVTATIGATESPDPNPYKLYRGGADTEVGVDADGYPIFEYQGGTQISQHATLAELTGVLKSDDCIKVAPGTYNPTQKGSHVGRGELDVTVEHLTVEWLVAGKRPVVNMAGIAIVYGFWLQMGGKCRHLRVRGIEGIGSYIGDNNQRTFIYAIPGYRVGIDRRSLQIPTSRLIVDDCAFRDWTFGVLAAENWNLTYIQRRCATNPGTGGGFLPHGVYIGEIKEAYFRGNFFLRDHAPSTQPKAGHLLKSRAKKLITKANFFYSASSGVARDVDVSNGGELIHVGNTHIHGPSQTYADSNQLIGFGGEQQGTPPQVRDGRTHSALIAQNTFKDYQNPSMPVVRFFAVKNEDGSLAKIAKAIRNNIAASATSNRGSGLGADAFVSEYPNNSAVSMSEVEDTSGALKKEIAGNPAIADANAIYAGQFEEPHKRKDTWRGASPRLESRRYDHKVTR